MPNTAGQPIIADFEGEIPWDELDHAGYDGAAFYIERRKCPSAGWVAEGAHRGRLLLPIMELTGKGAAAGADKGRAHAAGAIADLRRLGVPAGVPVANAEADSDLDPAATDAYYGAFHDAMTAAGWPDVVCYGSGAVGQRAKQAGRAAAHWLTCSGGFRGSAALVALITAGKPSGVDIWQRCAGQHGLVTVAGRDVDTDIVLNPELGLWGQTTTTPTGGFLMALNDAQQAELVADVAAIRSALLVDIKVDQDDAGGDNVQYGSLRGWLAAIAEHITGGDPTAMQQIAARAVALDPSHAKG